MEANVAVAISVNALYPSVVLVAAFRMNDLPAEASRDRDASRK
jgi:hypothetical protein